MPHYGMEQLDPDFTIDQQQQLLNSDGSRNDLALSSDSLLFPPVEDNDNVIEKIHRQIPRLKFRDWSMGVDVNPNLNSIVAAAAPSDSYLDTDGVRDTFSDGGGGEVDLDLDLGGQGHGSAEEIQRSLYMTESTLTFFLGSALLFLAAITVILALVASQRAYRQRRWRNQMRTKRLKNVDKVLDASNNTSDNSQGEANGLGQEETGLEIQP